MEELALRHLRLKKSLSRMSTETGQDQGSAMTTKFSPWLQEGNGLKGIRERLAEFSGSLELRMLYDGIEATVRIPIHTRAAGEAT